MSARPPAKPPYIAVIGGGIVGLSVAWTLARGGAAVTVYDAGDPGAASPASGGMLSAVAEAGLADPEFTRDCILSRGLWPAFGADLERASGLPIGLDLSGNVLVALDPDEAQALAARAASGDGELSRADPGAEPALSRRAHAVFFAGRDGVVDPRRAIAALKRALDVCGVERIPAAVQRIAVEGGRAAGVIVSGRTRAAGAVVLAGGVWSAALLVASGLEGLLAPLRPVKGQMLALAPSPIALRRVVRGRHHYLIPRGAHIVVGATSEPERFDTAVTPEAISALREGAAALVPALADCAVTDAWAGLRPAFPDGRPVIGASALPGLVLALGHYRNGVLLAPLTAQRIATELLPDFRAAGEPDGRPQPSVA